MKLIQSNKEMFHKYDVMIKKNEMSMNSNAKNINEMDMKKVN